MRGRFTHDAAGRVDYAYDSRGRPSETTRSYGGNTYEVDQSYDAADRLTQVTYPLVPGAPTSETVSYSYGADFRLTAAASLTQTYASGALYTAQGKLKELTYGNGLKGTWSYNDGTAGNQRLFETKVLNGSTELSSLQTYWGPAGNLTRRTNWALPGVEDLVFGYDNRNRLTSVGAPAAGNDWGNGPATSYASGPNGTYSASYAYDASGRMTLKDEPGAAVTMTYTGSGPVHAPKTVNGQSMSYDAHGNLTSGRGRSYSYDGLQRTKTVTANGVTTTYWYDADGRPVLRDELTTSGTITKTLLIDNLFEVDVTPNGSNAGATTSSYFFGGQRVAQRSKTHGVSDTLQFLHGDHLGSQALVTDSSGGEVSRVSYLPYGGTRLGSQTGAFGFTDQRLERQHGLNYFGNGSGYGRFYDSGIGVWTQPDPIVPGVDAISINRFAYVRASPLTYADPNGHCATFNTGEYCARFGWGFVSRVAQRAAEGVSGALALGQAYAEYRERQSVLTRVTPGMAEAGFAAELAQALWDNRDDIVFQLGEDAAALFDDLVSADPERTGAAAADLAILIAPLGKVAWAGKATRTVGGELATAVERMSARAAAYQVQITGNAIGEAYLLNGVKFDGLANGVLLEAKDPGYARFLNKGSNTFRPWFEGQTTLLQQADRQLQAANGIPIRWHVAEKDAADAIRSLLETNGYGAIEVVYSPASP